ncbi:hypothetical protein BH09PLA1_BH09PLA1_11730 [soil metagenome]
MFLVSVVGPVWICFVGMSLGENRSGGRIRGGLQRLTQPAKQGLHLLFVQHGGFHQQRTRPSRREAQVVLDRQLNRIFYKPGRLMANDPVSAQIGPIQIGPIQTGPIQTGWQMPSRRIDLAAELWWGIHSHAARLLRPHPAAAFGGCSLKHYPNLVRPVNREARN